MSSAIPTAASCFVLEAMETKSYAQQLAGLKVLFPYENPYPQQKVIMSRLITALKQKKNCLIESPTGTGKSLSLLCAALSYCEEEKRKFQKGLVAFPKGRPSTSDGPSVTLSEEESDLSTTRKSVMDMYEEECVKLHNDSTHKSLLNEKTPLADNVRMLKPPKIFYGTRTHRQVSQVVNEFRRTGYTQMKMTILGSRDRLCVNRRAITSVSGISEECQKLRKEARNGNGCSFLFRLQKANRYIYPTILENKKVEPWDIEDIVAIGKKQGLCPYYWTVQLSEDADIIFCPYNYILDPRIRKAVDINLENNIVILDEAHNIEDICREAMGLEINLSDILFVEDLIELTLRKHNESAALMQISPSVGALRHILLTEAADVPIQKPKQVNSDQLCLLLETASLGPKSWPRSMKILNELLKENAEEDNSLTKQDEERILDSRSRVFFDAIANTMGHMYKMDQKYTDCFRGAISKKIPKENKNELNGSPEITLQIYCVNPAVALVDIKEQLHSLVVASGTLSPMESFQCELDIPFPLSLSLNHVVKEEQVLACVVTKGPKGRSIVCDYKNNSEFTLQDEVGDSLARIVARVPNGVLCFFPSYALMNKLKERWELTGLWSTLERTKNVFVEGKMNFQEQMREYYESSLTTQGALLLAVCRGRVSEGEDFPDNFARAAVIIGIPFPNSREVTVGDKMLYNDLRLRKKDAVLSGSDWYKTQAFRALNQALGRCIRHSEDWGAIILLESRISSYRGYKAMLPRWIKERLVEINSFHELESRLDNFVDERKHEAVQKGSDGRSSREQAKLEFKSKASKRKSFAAPKSNYAIFNPPLKRKTSQKSNDDSSASFQEQSSSTNNTPRNRLTMDSPVIDDKVVTIVDSPERSTSETTTVGLSSVLCRDTMQNSCNFSENVAVDDDSSDLFSD